MNILIIVNPISGNRKGGLLAVELRTYFMSVTDIPKFNLEQIETTAILNAENIILSLTYQPDIIFIIGGDGTIHQVGNGVLARGFDKTTMLCPIPAGTGNAICTSLGIYGVSDAISAYKSKKKINIDVTQVKSGTRTIYSLLNIMYGLLSDIDINSEWLRYLGSFRFSLYAIWYILNRRHYEIVINNRPINICTLVYSNFPYLTSTDRIAENATPTDGLIDNYLCHGKISSLDLLRIFLYGFTYNSPHIIRQQTSEVSLKQLVGGINIDGELYSNMIDIECKVLENRLTFLFQNIT